LRILDFSDAKIKSISTTDGVLKISKPRYST